MRPWNTIVLAQVALRLVPKILDPVDMVLPFSKQKRMIDPVVLEPGHVQRVVAPPAVSINNAVGSDFFLYNRHQRCRRRIGNDLRIDLAATLQKTEDSRFSLGAASALSFSAPAEVALVQLNLAIEGFVEFAGCSKGDDFAKPLKVVGCRHFVDADQAGGASRARSGDEMLDEFYLLASAESALSHILYTITPN